MKNIIKNKIILSVLLALAFILPGNLVLAQSATPAVSYPSPAATNLTTTSATLNASVNPNGASTNIWFEVKNLSGNLSPQNIGSGSSNVSLTHDLSGLNPGTTYSFRVVATNQNGTINGQYQEFQTVAISKPTISNARVTNLTYNSATITAEVNPNNSSTNTWFETSNSSGPLSPKNIGSGASSVTVSYDLTGLASKTEYTFRLEAVNIIGSSSSGTIKFKTTEAPLPGTPVITTTPATSVSTNSAYLNANYNANNASAYVRFAYGVTSTNLNNYTSYQSVGSGSSSVSQYISGLTDNTVYYFRAEIYNGQNSSSTSPIQSNYIYNFTTSIAVVLSAPSINTSTTSGITTSSATLNGSFNANNSATYTRFAYGVTSTNLNNYTSYVYQGTGSGSFNQTVSGLTANTTYYFRAEGYNSIGTNYGSTISFITLAEANSYAGQYPLTVTKNSSLVKETSATLNGQLTNSYALPVTGWFEYGPTLSLGTTTPKVAMGSNTSITFSANVTDLQNKTIYYYQAVSENAGGKTVGEILVFQTGGTSNSTNTSTENNSGTVNENVSGNNGATEKKEALSISIETRVTKIIPGNNIDYFVTYKNNAPNELKNVVLRVVLPSNLLFLKSTNGDFNLADNTLTVNAPNLKAGEEKVIFLSNQIKEGVKTKETLLTTVTASYKNGSKSEEVLAITSHEVDSLGQALAAAVIFGESGILPNTLIEWIVLILVMAGLVIIGRKVYLDKEKKKIISNNQAPVNLPIKN